MTDANDANSAISVCIACYPLVSSGVSDSVSDDSGGVGYSIASQMNRRKRALHTHAHTHTHTMASELS